MCYSRPKTDEMKKISRKWYTEKRPRTMYINMAVMRWLKLYKNGNGNGDHATQSLQWHWQHCSCTDSVSIMENRPGSHLVIICRLSSDPNALPRTGATTTVARSRQWSHYWLQDISCSHTGRSDARNDAKSNDV